MPKSKYYVVWNGVTPGIYNSWADCQLQIKGYPGAQYASFKTRGDAEAAYEQGYDDYRSGKQPSIKSSKIQSGPPKEVEGSWSVDAACSGNPGKMEYRGVFTDDGSEIFHLGPFLYGTNNVGEFLALVHAAALLKRMGDHEKVIYSDSRIAMGWVQKKKARTKLKITKKTEALHELISRAEKWLAENEILNPIKKWETKSWGEIPADFGRK